MPIAPSQCGPDETVVSDLWWVCAPIWWIECEQEKVEAWHDTTLLWAWFEVSKGRWKAPSWLWFAPPQPRGLKAEALSCWSMGAFQQTPGGAEKTGWGLRAAVQCSWAAKLRRGSYQICCAKYCRGDTRASMWKSAQEQNPHLKPFIQTSVTPLMANNAQRSSVPCRCI